MSAVGEGKVVHRLVYITHGIIRVVSLSTRCGLSDENAVDADSLTERDADVTCPACLAEMRR